MSLYDLCARLVFNFRTYLVHERADTFAKQIKMKAHRNHHMLDSSTVQKFESHGQAVPVVYK